MPCGNTCLKVSQKRLSSVKMSLLAPEQRIEQVKHPRGTSDVMALDFRQSQRTAFVHIHQVTDGDVLLLYQSSPRKARC